MKPGKLLLGAALCAAALPVKAQFTISAGDNSLEIGGRIAGYYNQRYIKDGLDDYKKNRFGLRDLQINLEGRRGNNWQYELQVDFADLASNSAAGTIIDPENPGLMKAFIEYKGLPVHIKFGYDKLPYSQGSLSSIYNSPYWSRGPLIDGSLFTRRDVGVTLSSSLLRQRLNLYGGVYTGLGENVIANGDNDASGNPEFIGRADFSFPSRYRFDEIDEVGVPIPVMRIGANARYTNKTQPGTRTLPTTVNNDYNLRVVDGEKWVYGFDATFAYKHFSAQAEYQHILARPSKQNNVLFYNSPESLNNGQVNAGGYLLQANYDFQKLKSVFSARYQNVNLNDLVFGNSEWLYFAYAYKIKGFRNVIKLQYYRPLTEDSKLDPQKYTAQIRVGWQHSF